MTRRRARVRRGRRRKRSCLDLLTIYAINQNLKDPVLSSFTG